MPGNYKKSQNNQFYEQLRITALLRSKYFLHRSLIGTEIIFKLFMPAGNKRLHILKQTSS